MSKVGYKLIADKYGKNIATVEKDIQNSINNAWLYGNSELLYKTFGATISDGKGKPTNKHFIYTMKKLNSNCFNIFFDILYHKWNICKFSHIFYFWYARWISL